MTILSQLEKTMGLSTWQLTFLSILIIFVANYLTIIFIQRFNEPKPLTSGDLLMSPQKGDLLAEGFSDMKGSQANETKYEWLNNDRLYDQFYASIYDQLVQGSNRNQIEVALLMEKWKFSDRGPNELRILDAGCGTGVTTLAFAKTGVNKVVGLDKSQAMIDFARTTNINRSVLTDTEKKNIEWRTANLLDANACKPQEFDAACALYFTIYYLRDIDGFFRNMSLWVRPGGKLAVQVVNKYKFDPILDSASPFVFSVQKYTKKRVQKSKVVFDKFDYEADFHLEDDDENVAEFRETFRFRDNSVRRQRHTFNMPAINVIVKKAKAAGWLYDGYIDELAAGFEYSYLLLFHH